MSKLKPTTNEGFVRPDPGNVLLKAEKVEFKKITEGDNIGELQCVVTNEVVDHFQAEDSIGIKQFDRHNLWEINGRYFGVTNLLGVIWKATGKELEVDADYFEDESVQDKIVKKLTDCMYGGEFVESKDKKYLNLKNYVTKDEFKELKKTLKDTGKNDKGKGAGKEEPAKAAAGDDDWD